MKHKLLYISGPYSATPANTIGDNIHAAREVAIWCACKGIYYFCPHMHSARMEVIAPLVPYEFWLAMDLHILKMCQGILMLPRWEKSYGSSTELNQAMDMGLRIFYWPEQQESIKQWASE